MCWCGAPLFLPLIFFPSFSPVICRGLRLTRWCFLSVFCVLIFSPQIFPDSSHGRHQRNWKKTTESNLVWEHPLQLLSKWSPGRIGFLAFWPWSLCCQHFGRFVGDVIRNQNNSQMKKENSVCKMLLCRCYCMCSLHSESLSQPYCLSRAHKAFHHCAHHGHKHSLVLMNAWMHFFLGRVLIGVSAVL